MPREKQYKRPRKGTYVMLPEYERALVQMVILPHMGHGTTMTELLSHCVRYKATEIASSSDKGYQAFNIVLKEHGVSFKEVTQDFEKWKEGQNG